MKLSLKLLTLSISLFIGGMIFTSCSNGGPGDKVSINEQSSSEIVGPIESEHKCEFNLVEKREPTCKEEGYERYECECGEFSEKKLGFDEHLYSEWYFLVEPTEYQSGEKQRHCEVCGFRQNEYIPSLGEGEKPDDPENPNEPDDPNKPDINEGHQEWHAIYYDVFDMENHSVTCEVCEDRKSVV